MPTIAYHEMLGYPRETRDILGNFSAVRKLLVAWDDRFGLRDALLEWPGALYPYRLSDTFEVRAVECGEMEPFGGCTDVVGDDHLLQYPFAIIPVKYQTPRIDEAHSHPSYPSTPEAALSETIEPWHETRRLDYTLFKWGDGTALKPEEAPFELVSRVRYCLTRYNQTEVPDAAIKLVDCCNQNTVYPIMLSSAWFFPPYTLKFEPPTLSMTADANGVQRYTLAYKFSYKEETWRKFYRPKTATHAAAYQSIYEIATGTQYQMPPAGDFSPLFAGL